MPGSSLFYSLTTCGKKKVFKAFNSTRKYMENLGGFDENYSFVELNYEYVMVARLENTNTIAPSIFFVGGTQAPILDTTYYERSP